MSEKSLRAGEQNGVGMGPFGIRIERSSAVVRSVSEVEKDGAPRLGPAENIDQEMTR